MQERKRKTGSIYYISFLWIRQLHVHTVEGMKTLLQSNTNITKCASSKQLPRSLCHAIAWPRALLVMVSPYLRVAEFYNPLIPWLGISLLTSTGARWKAKRRLLTPAFHFKILQNYVAVNIEQTTVFLDMMYACTRAIDPESQKLIP